MMRTSIIAAALLLSSTVRAQTSPPPPSPADLALATDIAGRIFPDGTYQRILGTSMTGILEGMVDQMSNLQLAPLLASSGLPANTTARIGRTTMRQVMDVIDPAYEKRMRIEMPILTTELASVMTRFEPEMRQGLADSYAHRFTGEQLADIDRFMRTPSGAAFAAQSMTMSSDPAVTARMRNFIPTLVQSMPAIMGKATAAAAALPKAKTYAELTPADRTRLSQLLGTAPRSGAASGAATSPRPPIERQGPNAPPKPPADIAALFGPDHYPPEALRSSAQGRVVADLSVDARGRVEGCVIGTSSGSAALDATTCRIATDELVFSPATDRDAKPMRGTFRLPVRWVLPPDAPAPPSASSPSSAAPTG